jgi:hypothetical protein
MAEGVGFEPTVRINRTLDFESSPFDHSGIPPRASLAARSVAGKRFSLACGLSRRIAAHGPSRS